MSTQKKPVNVDVPGTGSARLLRRQFLKGAVAVAFSPVAVPWASGTSRAIGAETEPGIKGYRLGMYTRPWDQFDYRVALDAIAEAGYRYAGLMTTNTAGRRLVITWNLDIEEARKVGEEASQRGLQIPSVYSDFAAGQPQEKATESLRRLIDNCVAAGARSLLLGGIGNANLYEHYFATIRDCCDYAAERRLVLTIKPHGGLNATGPQCRQAIERVGHPNFSLWYDPGNIYFYSDGKLDPVEDAATVDGLVREGMCIKDFVLSTDGDRVSKDVWVTPGAGKVNFLAVLRRLRQGGFRQGDLVIECINRPDPQNLQQLLSEARVARQFMEGVLNQL